MKNINILSEKGITLAEIMLAAAILAFALVGILLLFVNCSLLNEASRNLTRAASHAQFVMEDIKNANFATLKSNIESGIWNWDINQIEGNELSPLDNQTIVTQCVGTDPLSITVTVSWQDHRQRAREYTLDTIIGGL
jgi:Tfp pilus assembly protein PilV